MGETIVRALTVSDTIVAEGFAPMPEPYQRVMGLAIEADPLVWDERTSPGSSTVIPKPSDIQAPPEAGQVMRVRGSTLTPENVSKGDIRLSELALHDMFTLIPEEVPFTKLTEHIMQGNVAAARPATYDEVLYALELARLVTAEDSQHRIACYELSLTAAFFCHTKSLSVYWCLGMSLETGEPHAWLEVDDTPVRGEADEIITGVYKRLLKVGINIAQ